MLKKIKLLFSNSTFLVLIIAPYLINSIGIKLSQPSFFFLIVGLFLIEFGYQKLSSNIYKRSKFEIAILIIPTIIIVFYFQQFEYFVNKLNSVTINLSILRLRYYLPILWIIIWILIYNFRKKNGYIIINTYFLILGISTFLSIVIAPQQKKIGGHFIEMNESHTKPVILLIVDEYSSPTELYKNKTDSSIFEFNKTLISAGWKVNHNQCSDNLFTVHSLSSLFNYNLKLKDTSLTINESIQNLRESKLILDLYKKNVSFHNFGIFDIGNTKAFSKIHFYGKDEKSNSNIFKSFFANSLIGLLYADFTQLDHNKFLVENGLIKLRSLIGKKKFIYIHILMPHGPFEYNGYNNFKLKKLNNVDNYISYWHFTNSVVMEKLLKPLVESNQFKIILTGDHGFRGERDKVNPHQTITAFYGFNSSKLDQIKSVQDLGSLINSSY
jgi:hypothetical protein